MAALLCINGYNEDPKWASCLQIACKKYFTKIKFLEMSMTRLQIIVVQRNIHKKGKYKMTTSADIHDRIVVFAKGLCTEPWCLKIASPAYLKSQRTIY